MEIEEILKKALEMEKEAIQEYTIYHSLLFDT